MYCNFQTWLGLQAKQKILIDDLIMTAWWPINNFQNIHEMRTRFTTWLKNLYVKETIILFHIECKLLQIIHTIVDISYLQ